mgnify:CR=1 FL=1
MSTKTLRKRIALATVAALGAGVLSLVSTTAAHATANSAAGTAGHPLGGDRLAARRVGGHRHGAVRTPRRYGDG